MGCSPIHAGVLHFQFKSVSGGGFHYRYSMFNFFDTLAALQLLPPVAMARACAMLGFATTLESV